MHSKGCRWLLRAARHKSTCRIYLGSIIFVIQGVMLRLSKNPNAYSHYSKQPGGEKYENRRDKEKVRERLIEQG